MVVVTKCYPGGNLEREYEADGARLLFLSQVVVGLLVSFAEQN